MHPLSLDPVVLEMVVQADKLTQQDKDNWTIAANALIRMGDFEAVSEKGLQQGIDNIAYRIAQRSIALRLAGLTPEDGTAMYAEELGQVSDIMTALAFGSKTHIFIVNARIAVRIGEYVAEMMTQMYQR